MQKVSLGVLNSIYGYAPLVFSFVNKQGEQTVMMRQKKDTGFVQVTNLAWAQVGIKVSLEA